MIHPSLEAIVAGSEAIHLARCEPCRKLAILVGAAPPARIAELDFPEPVAVADEVYTDWHALPEARGGMGQIFRVRDRRLGRHVAIKQLRADLEHGERPALARRFEREARLTARLQHPSIVGVYETGRFGDGEPFYAMPMLRGVPLGTAIAQRPELASRLGLVAHVTAVAEAIAYAHDQGVVHRDLKPDNILVGTFGETVVIDWGLAKELGEPPGETEDAYRTPATDGLTQLGVGTAHYMPPEQATGDEPDRRADVYSIGATLYHTLAGQPPYDRDSPDQVRRALTDGRPPRSLAELVPGVPGELVGIVERAMATEREHRFASARELADELHRFQTGQLLTSRRYTLGELAHHFARRHRAALRVAAAAAVVLVAGAGLAVARIARERDRAEASQGQAEAELRRARGVIASQLAADPTRRLDAIALAAGAVSDAMQGHLAPAPEAMQGLLDALTAGPPLVALAHAGVIKAFAATDDLLAGVDDARALVLWDPRSGHLRGSYPTALPQPERAVISPDHRQIVVCGFDPIGELFDAATGAGRTFEARASLAGCGFLPDGALITAADDVAVRDPLTLRIRQRFALPSVAIGMTIAGSGAVAVATLEGELWSWQPGHAPSLSATHLPISGELKFSRDERALYSIGKDQIVRRFERAQLDTAPAALYHDPGAHLSALVLDDASGVLGVAIDDVDQTLRSVVIDPADAHRPADRAADAPPRELAGTIRAWARVPGWAIVDHRGPLAVVDIATGGTVLALDAHAEQGTAIAFADRLATASRDGAAYLWDLETGRDTGLMLGHTGEIVELAARGARMLTASHDGSTRVWGNHDELLATVRGPAPVTAAAWLGDAAFITGDLAGGLALVEAASGQTTAQLALGAPVSAIAVDPQGARVAVATLGGTLAIYDRDLGPSPVIVGAHELAATASAITAIVWAPDGTTIVSAHADGSTRRWLAATGQLIAVRADPTPVDEPGDHEGHLRLVYTDDATRILAVRPAGQTLVLDALTLAVVATLEGRLVGAIAPDHRHLVTALGDGGLLIHDLADSVGADAVHSPPRRLVGPRSPTLAAAYSADGEQLATAVADGSTWLWDARTGSVIATLHGTGLGAATAVTFAAERVVIGHAHGALRSVPVTPMAALHQACGVLRQFARDAPLTCK